MSDESKELLDAYVRGVNSCADKLMFDKGIFREEYMAPEIVLLNLDGKIEWESWTPADSISIFKMMSF